jgi:alkaline phosphatase D
MPDADVEVTWRLARDENFQDEVASGRVLAARDFGHAVHAVPVGLAPDSWYFYRFEVGDATSPVGRTRTLPAAGAAVSRLRFAYVSCQNYEQGYFAPFKFMAEDELDFVVHLGDYIYEYGQSEIGTKNSILPYQVVRQHHGPPIMTLDDYRNRYALYKSDPNLMAAHAVCPWFTTWDDHEIEDNWAGFQPGAASKLESYAFLLRRAAAFQAYFEHMPVRPRPGTRLYRNFAFGDLANFFVLDTRQYRTPQPCGSSFPSVPECPAMYDEGATMTGPEQEAWLLGSLERSAARWNVLAQQTLLAQYDYGVSGHAQYNMDQWDGYRAQRSRMLKFLAAKRPRNPMVLTGDWHSFWANDIKADFADPASETLATEYVGSSISSVCTWRDLVSDKLDQNPHVRYFEGNRRGYVRTTVTPDTWQADYLAVSDPLEPDTRKVRIETLRSFATEDGKPGVQNT